MPKKASPEERITDYFNHAPLLQAQTMFNVVKGIMKGRIEREAEGGEDDRPVPVKRKARKPRTQSEQTKARAASATSANASEQGEAA